MQKLTFLFLIVFSSLCMNAQVNLDSLYTVWQDKTQADSSRIKALDDYIWFGYVYSNPDRALILCDTLFEFSEKRGNKKIMATALNMKGVAYYVKSDYTNALKQHQRSLKIKEELGNKKGIAASLNNIGNIYNDQGNYPQAFNYYQRSLEISGKIGDKKGITSMLNNIGNIYIFQSNYPKALNYYQRSLKIAEEIGDKLEISFSLGNIGIIYNYTSDYQNALDYLQRSLKIKEELGNKQGIARSLNNIGTAYTNQGDYSEALDYIQRSLKINEEIGDKRGISSSLDNIGTNYINLNDYPKALEYYQRSLKIHKEIGDKYGIASSSNNISHIYIKQGLFNNAIAQCQKLLILSKEIEAIDFQKQACNCLYEAYKGLGNGNKALAYHEQMLVLNDSLQTEETAKKLQRMEFSKQVLADSLVQVDKNLKVEMVHQSEVRKKDKNKNIAIGAGIFFLLLAGGFYGRWRYVKKSKAVIEKEKDRSENLLLNILPSEIAEELKAKGSADARDFDMVSILFTDFKGFTQASEKLTAKELIEEINVCFKAFDHICEKFGIEKIKTIGDAYMAAGGLPVPSEDSVKNTILAALEMQSFISERIIEKQAKNEIPFEMRLGIHTGPVVAGIVGVKKFQYDIWGDTVNTASRMESSGEVGKVNISEATHELIKDDPEFIFKSRGKIEAKGKGEIEMYFVDAK